MVTKREIIEQLRPYLSLKGKVFLNLVILPKLLWEDFNTKSTTEERLKQPSVDETKQLIIEILEATGGSTTKQVKKLVNLLGRKLTQAREDDRKDNEILINTILETKNKEIEEAYKKGVCDGRKHH